MKADFNLNAHTSRFPLNVVFPTLHDIKIEKLNFSQYFNKTFKPIFK
ncbi:MULTISPECIES: hypothetical protein [Nostoc]|uniref:Uncharacterized protein n=1 Tax=Nostoc spongiaeforme FACHB-130 TaxID=1357510 RepID=A0ABR8G506_9NOSO|nr:MULTISPECIES: hypothetical protein [Nostoc]MBD2441312.1 hypothetical protein [Nostoc sp. FACHB-110]MBD2598322.1 hypothetical protein [Nostoc spongiaeforme FACHB-130]